MSRRPLPTVATLPALVLALALAGCSSDPEPLPADVAGDPAPSRAAEPASHDDAPAATARAPAPETPAAARPSLDPPRRPAGWTDGDDRSAGSIIVGGARATASGPLAESVPINVTARGADLADLVAAVATQVGRRVSVDPSVHERVTVELVNTPWRRSLDLVARLARCTVEARGDALVIERTARVTFESSGGPLALALTQVVERSGAPVRIDVPAGLDDPISVKYVDRPWRSALEDLARRGGVRLDQAADVITVVPVRAHARVVTHDGTSLGVRQEDGRVVTLRLPDGPAGSARAARRDALRAAISPLAFDDAVVVRWGEADGSFVLRELAKD